MFLHARKVSPYRKCFSLRKMFSLTENAFPCGKCFSLQKMFSHAGSAFPYRKCFLMRENENKKDPAGAAYRRLASGPLWCAGKPTPGSGCWFALGAEAFLTKCIGAPPMQMCCPRRHAACVIKLLRWKASYPASCGGVQPMIERTSCVHFSG